jgi:hypothetical protein
MSGRQSVGAPGRLKPMIEARRSEARANSTSSNKFRHGAQLVPALAAQPSKQNELALADRRWIIEEPGLVQLVAFTKLIRADAKTLRRINGCLGVENQRPFERRCGLPDRSLRDGSGCGLADGGGAKARTAMGKLVGG